MRNASDSPLLQSIAAEIKFRRSTVGISQEELAYRAGVHRSFVARLEVAATQPSVAVLFRLAHALSSEPAELVAGISRRCQLIASRLSEADNSS